MRNFGWMVPAVFVWAAATVGANPPVEAEQLDLPATTTALAVTPTAPAGAVAAPACASGGCATSERNKRLSKIVGFLTYCPERTCCSDCNVCDTCRPPLFTYFVCRPKPCLPPIVPGPCDPLPCKTPMRRAKHFPLFAKKEKCEAPVAKCPAPVAKCEAPVAKCPAACPAPVAKCPAPAAKCEAPACEPPCGRSFNFFRWFWTRSDCDLSGTGYVHPHNMAPTPAYAPPTLGQLYPEVGPKRPTVAMTAESANHMPILPPTTFRTSKPGHDGKAP